MKGFSRRNLMKMKQSSETAQLDTVTNELFMQSATAQMHTEALKAFWLVSFSHHIVLLGKCKILEERLFYIAQTASQFWSVTVLEHQIDACLFQEQGKLPNNFF